MKNREQRRMQKQEECQRRIAQAYETMPELEQLDQEIAAKSLMLIRSGMLKKSSVKMAEAAAAGEALLAKRRAFLAERGLDESIYAPQWDCPICQDRGYLEDGRWCQCYRQERLDQLFVQSGIPAQMRAYCFDNFETSFYQDPEGMQRKVESCKEFVRRLKAGSLKSNLVLIGDVGRGKTHLSIAIANAAMANGNTVVYKRMDDLLELIRLYKYDNDMDQEKSRKALEQLRQCDLLVIDDLGAEKITEFAQNQLRLLIEDRNLDNKPWVINSNLGANELQETYGARAFDRIQEKALFYRLDSKESLRALLRSQKAGWDD